PAHGADLLHGCFPQAARPDVLPRPLDARRSAARVLSRLLARGRPPLGNGPRDRLLRADVGAAPRRPPRRARLARAVPGAALVPAADLHRPRPAAPDPDRDAAPAAPAARRRA